MFTILSLMGCGGPSTQNPSGEVALPVSISLRSVPGLLDTDGCVTVTADVLDQEGSELPIEVDWNVSNTDVATVDAAGLLCGVGDGNVEIWAAVDGIESERARLMTVPLADAAVTVDDADLVDWPSQQGSSSGGLTEIRLSYVTRGAEPTTGDIVVGTGDAPIMGRVVAVDAVDDGARVTFEVVGPWEALDAPVDLELPMHVDAEDLGDIGDESVVVHDPETGWFTVTDPDLNRNASGPRFNCKKSLNVGGDVVLQGNGQLKVVQADPERPGENRRDLVLDLHLGAIDDWSVEFAGNLEQSLNASLLVEGEIAANLDCTVELASPDIPVGGWLTYIIGGLEVPLGLRGQLQPRVSLSGEVVRYELNHVSPFRVGWRVTPTGASLVNQAPTFPDPTSGKLTFFEGRDLAGLELDVELGIFAYAQLRFHWAEIYSGWDLMSDSPPGSPYSSETFTIAHGEAGLVADMHWEPLPAQFDDPDDESTWALRGVATVKAGDDLVDLGNSSLDQMGPWWRVIWESFQVPTEVSASAPLLMEPLSVVNSVVWDETRENATVAYTDANVVQGYDWWCEDEATAEWRPATVLYATELTVGCASVSSRIGASADDLGIPLLPFSRGVWEGASFCDQNSDSCVWEVFVSPVSATFVSTYNYNGEPVSGIASWPDSRTMFADDLCEIRFLTGGYASGRLLYVDNAGFVRKDSSTPAWQLCEAWDGQSAVVDGFSVYGATPVADWDGTPCPSGSHEFSGYCSSAQELGFATSGSVGPWTYGTVSGTATNFWNPNPFFFELADYQCDGFWYARQVPWSDPTCSSSAEIEPWSGIEQYTCGSAEACWNPPPTDPNSAPPIPFSDACVQFGLPCP